MTLITVAQHDGCKRCSLCTTEGTWRPAGLNYDAKFLFIVEQYHPTAANRLKRLLRSCDFDTSDMEVVFLTRCLSPEDKKAQFREGQHCLPLFSALVEKFSQDTTLVPCGATCCKLIAGKKSIQTAHGTVGEAYGRICVPTLHPAQVVAYPDSLPTFLADLDKLVKAANGEVEEVSKTKYTLVDTMDKLEAMAEELLNSSVFAFDIESSSLNPYRSAPYPPQVLLVSFTNKAGSGWAVPVDHREAPWTRKENKRVKAILKEVLESSGILKVPHNGGFDTKYLSKVEGIEVSDYNFDTMLAHYIGVTEEKGTHGLKILAWEYTDMGGYDDALDDYKKEHPEADPDRGGSYANIPLEVLWPYAVADTDCTFRLLQVLKDKVYPEFTWLFDHIVMPAQKALRDIEMEGAPIDWEWYEHCAKEYPKLMEHEVTRLREFPEVLELERQLTRRKKQKKLKERKARFAKRATEIVALEKTDPDKAEKKRLRLIADWERAEKTPVVVAPAVFNPAAPAQKERLLFDVMGFKSTKKAKGGGRSTDKEVIKELWAASKHPVVQCLGKFTKMHTLYGMFVKPLPEIICDDGRLRGGYLVHGTETGRLSMSSPNLQQIPKNPKDDAFMDVKLPSIKKMFKALPGYAILQFDYSQAELRVLAALSNDILLREAYINGEDVHLRVAAEVNGIDMSEVTDQQRGAAKAVNFGLLYGQGAKRLAKALGWTEDQAKEFISEYFAKLPGVRRYIARQKAHVREAGEVRSPFGRVRRLASVFSPESDIVAKAERQGVNARIQSTASDCTLASIIRINKYLRKNGLKSRIIITVHDSVVIHAHLSEVKRVYQKIKILMETPPNSDWLNGIPFVADAEIGPSWGELTPIKTLSDIDAYLSAGGPR